MGRSTSRKGEDGQQTKAETMEERKKERKERERLRGTEAMLTRSAAVVASCDGRWRSETLREMMIT